MVSAVTATSALIQTAIEFQTAASCGVVIDADDQDTSSSVGAIQTTHRVRNPPLLLSSATGGRARDQLRRGVGCRRCCAVEHPRTIVCRHVWNAPTDDHCSPRTALLRRDVRESSTRPIHATHTVQSASQCRCKLLWCSEDAVRPHGAMVKDITGSGGQCLRHQLTATINIVPSLSVAMVGCPVGPR